MNINEFAAQIISIVQANTVDHLDRLKNLVKEHLATVKKGDKGDKGSQGKDGERGIQGLPGRNGANGKDGAKGDKGDPGKDGLPGKNGKDGINGKDGVDGLPGKPGKDGVGISDVVKGGRTDEIKFILTDGSEKRIRIPLPRVVGGGGGGGSTSGLKKSLTASVIVPELKDDEEYAGHVSLGLPGSYAGIVAPMGQAEGVTVEASIYGDGVTYNLVNNTGSDIPTQFLTIVVIEFQMASNINTIAVPELRDGEEYSTVVDLGMEDGKNYMMSTSVTAPETVAIVSRIDTRVNFLLRNNTGGTLAAQPVSIIYNEVPS